MMDLPPLALAICLIVMAALWLRVLLLMRRIQRLDRAIALLTEAFELDYPQTDGCRNYYEEPLLSTDAAQLS